MTNKHERFWVIFLTVIALCLLFFFTFVDLEFSQSVYHYAIWMEWVLRLAPVPALVLAWLFAMNLTAYSIRGRLASDSDETPAFHMVVGFLSAIAIPVYTYWSVMRFLQRDTDANAWIMLFVLIACSVWGALRLIKELPTYANHRRASRSLAGLMLFYADCVAVMILAFLWQRVSYRTIISVGSTAEYTVWYLRNTGGLLKQISGNEVVLGSFPSTTVSFSFMLALSNYLQDGTHRKIRNVLLTLSFLYALFISVISVIMGTAYVTDCIIGILVPFLLQILTGKIYRRFNPAASYALYEMQSYN